MTIVYDVVFNDDGAVKSDLIRSSGRLERFEFSPQDKEVIQNINPICADRASRAASYNLKYQGKEKADELDCYVFLGSPKSTKGGRIYFKGKIWVDDRDLQSSKRSGNLFLESSWNINSRNSNNLPDYRWQILVPRVDPCG